ncbi:peroxidase, partial [Cellulomonas bogoriensis 69B4 = DSM 16987]
GGGVVGAGAGARWGSRAPEAPQPARAAGPGDVVVPCHGEHQAGIVTPPPSFIALVALDLASTSDRASVERLLRVWTVDIERLTTGRPGLADSEPELALVPAALTVTVGFGPGLLTAAGLRHRAPAWLHPLPPFGIDRLDPAWCDGDVVLQVCADDRTTLAHAVRVLTKEAQGLASVRWVQRGFRRSPGISEPDGTSMRNLMGQVEGTANLDPRTDPDLLWHRDGEPGWLTGGTSMVVRRIAMNLDTWDELSRGAREATIGRTLRTGAPLTGRAEHDEPDLEALDDHGRPVIDLEAHIRRARPTQREETFLRRAYNYDEAPPPGRASDSGLLFVTYQRDVDAQFTPVQRRLDAADLLNEWTFPVGSAVFAVPGGWSAGEYVGQRLLEG